jgi:UDP-glucose 4-epimerase
VSDIASAYSGRRVLVTGSTGFIGRWVARLLTRAGADLYLAAREPALARNLFAATEIEGHILPTHLTSARDVDALFETARPAVTFNLAGYGVDRSERDDTVATHINERVVRWTAAAAAALARSAWQGANFVHAGSALEYGTLGGHLPENAVPQPTTVYGRTKLAGTKAVLEETRSRGGRAIVARLFTVYGPGEHPGRLLPSLMDAADSRTTVALSTGNQRRDFTYVGDVAEGLLRLGCVDRVDATVVNLATGRLASVREFAELAAPVLGLPLLALHFGALPSRTDDMAHDDVTVERLRGMTGWVPPTSISEGVRLTVGFRRSCPAGRTDE